MEARWTKESASVDGLFADLDIHELMMHIARTECFKAACIEPKPSNQQEAGKAIRLLPEDPATPVCRSGRTKVRRASGRLELGALSA